MCGRESLNGVVSYNDYCVEEVVKVCVRGVACKLPYYVNNLCMLQNTRE